MKTLKLTPAQTKAVETHGETTALRALSLDNTARYVGKCLGIDTRTATALISAGRKIMANRKAASPLSQENPAQEHQAAPAVEKDKFHNKNGTLTAYAFACGYQESREANGVRVWLERDSACWHVRAHDGVNHVRLAWESFTLLTEARKDFRRQCREFLKAPMPESQENPAQEQQAGETEAPAPVCHRCGGDRDAGTSDAMQPGDTLCASCDAEDRETEAPAPAGMSPAVAFFYNNAGFSYDPETETPAEGRLRCAKALAQAEARASEAGIFYRWELDGNDSREWSDDEPATPTWICRMFDDESNVLDSISGVDFGDREPWGEPYRRETEAQLALQWCNSKGPDENEAPAPFNPGDRVRLKESARMEDEDATPFTVTRDEHPERVIVTPDGFEDWTLKPTEIHKREDLELVPAPFTDSRALAIAFVSKFSPKQRRKIDRANASLPDDVCASHDICDANEVMAEAFKDLTGRDAETNSMHGPDDCGVWSEAWGIAKREGFEALAAQA